MEETAKRRYVGVLLTDELYQQVEALAMEQGGSSLAAAIRKLIIDGLAARQQAKGGKDR